MGQWVVGLGLEDACDITGIRCWLLMLNSILAKQVQVANMFLDGLNELQTADFDSGSKFWWTWIWTFSYNYDFGSDFQIPVKQTARLVPIHSWTVATPPIMQLERGTTLSFELDLLP